MPVYENTEQFYQKFKLLFDRIISDYPEATQKVSVSRLVIRLACSTPVAEILINGRGNPIQVTYGPSGLRPDLDIELPADTLHLILSGKLTLTKAIASGQLKVKGPLWKSFVLEDVFKYGQKIYPQL